MKRFLSGILATSVILVGMPNAIAADSMKKAYEDFPYTESLKLNACIDSESDKKGFVGDWQGDVGLSQAVTENFSILGGGLITGTKSASNAIYRQLKTMIDFSKDNFYTISWDMKINSAAAITDNTRTQKVALTTVGNKTANQQLQFGFACGRREKTGVSAYMRTTSDIQYYDHYKINTDEMYHIFVTFNTSSAANDIITYTIYSENEETPVISQTENVALDSSYDVVYYQEYTGGTGNAFGNLLIEVYDTEAKSDIVNIQRLLAEAQEALTDVKLEKIAQLIADLPQGKVSKRLQSELDAIKTNIALDQKLAEHIENEIAELEKMTFSAENELIIREKITALEGRADNIINSEKKETLLSKLFDFNKLLDAALFVEKAEETQTTNDIEAAQEAISKLTESEAKEALQNRLNEVQKDIAVRVAEERTAQAEEFKTVSALETARLWVASLDAGEGKIKLTQRLDEVEKYINNYVPTITKFAILGDTAVGGQLKAHIEVEDLCGNLKEKIVNWYIADSHDGEYRQLNAAEDTLDIAYNYSGKYIKAVVYAINTSGVKGDETSNVVYVSKTAKTAYENFDYIFGAKLNSVAEAVGADDAKGFYSGWHSDESLTAQVDDSYIVAADGMLESTPSNKKIYRGINSSIDLRQEGIYILSWDMKANAGSMVSDNTRTQRFALTAKGASANTSQMQFGFVGSDYGMIPYMRTTSNLQSDTRTTIIPGKVYHLIAYIDTSNSKNDVVSYMVYGEDEKIKNEFNLRYEADLSGDFDLVGYMGYTGGGGKNAVGNIAVEFYDNSQKNMIQAAEDNILASVTALSIEKLDEAVGAISMLPAGKAKELLAAKISIAKAEIERVNEKLDEIVMKLSSLEHETITADNAGEIMALLKSIRESIEAIPVAEEKERFLEKYETTERTIQSQLILATRAADDFHITDCGWSTEYLAENGSKLEDMAIEDGALLLSTKKEIYRGMLYPAVADENYEVYVRLKFTLEDNGSIFLKLDNINVELADTFSLKYNNQTASGTTKLESGKEYTAVLNISNTTATLEVFADNEDYYGNHAISIEVEGLDTSVICFGGQKAEISEILKENAGIAYTGGVKTAIANMISDMSAENIAATKLASDFLVSSILKDMADKLSVGIEKVRDDILPKIRSVGISGTGKAGDMLTAICTLEDVIHNLKSINYEWYCGGSMVSKDLSFCPSSGDIGKNVFCKVTVTNTAGKTSAPIQSNTIRIVGSSGGASNGGGSGGGYTPAAEELPAPIFFENEQNISKDGMKFQDITGHWAEKYIIKMAEAGIAVGISDTEFKPDMIVTRAEFVTFLTRALNLSESEKNIGFSDIVPTDWFYTSVLAASDFVSGWDGQFHPHDGITREAMAKMICMACEEELTDIEDNENFQFVDASKISDWSIEYVKKVCAAGIFNGDDQNRFAPQDNATRAEVMKVITKLLDIVNP